MFRTICTKNYIISLSQITCNMESKSDTIRLPPRFHIRTGPSAIYRLWVRLNQA